MPRPSLRHLSLLAACASLVLTACGAPSVNNDSEIETAAAAGLETATTSDSPLNNSSIASTGSTSGSKRVSGTDDGDVSHYKKVVSITPETVSNNSLIIQVPYHADINVSEGNALKVNYKFVATKAKELKAVRPKAVDTTQSSDGTQLSLKLLKVNCGGIGIMNGILAQLDGLCLHSVQVTLPKGSEIDVHKTDPDGMHMTPIWQGKVPANGKELFAAIDPVFGDENKVAIIRRFVKENKKAKVSVQELEVIAKDIMFDEPQMEAIELLAPQVRRSKGKLKEKDIQGIVDEMFFDSEKDKVRKLLLK